MASTPSPSEENGWSLFRKIRFSIALLLAAVSAVAIVRSPDAESWPAAGKAALIPVAFALQFLIWWFVLPLFMAAAVFFVALLMPASRSVSGTFRGNAYVPGQGWIPFSGWWRL